jgi:hypothetical protein
MRAPIRVTPLTLYPPAARVAMAAYGLVFLSVEAAGPDRSEADVRAADARVAPRAAVSHRSAPRGRHHDRARGRAAALAGRPRRLARLRAHAGAGERPGARRPGAAARRPYRRRAALSRARRRTTGRRRGRRHEPGAGVARRRPRGRCRAAARARADRAPRGGGATAGPGSRVPVLGRAGPSSAPRLATTRRLAAGATATPRAAAPATPAAGTSRAWRPASARSARARRDRSVRPR